MLKSRVKHKQKRPVSPVNKSWGRFKKNKLAILSLFFVGFAMLISISGYLITPDSTPFANDQHLELTTQPPGFSVNMLRVKKNSYIEHKNFFQRMTWGEEKSYRSIPYYDHKFRNDSLIIEEYTGLPGNDGRLIRFHLADVAHSIQEEGREVSKQGNHIVFTTIDGKVHKKSLNELKEKIKKEHLVKRTFLLGTDRFGRDLLSQLMIGTRVSLSVGFVSVIISLIVGIFIGSLGGYFGGKTDDFVMWLINVVWSIPSLLLVIAITFALGKGFWQVFIAIGLTMWVEVARVVRGQVISVKQKEFVEASKALGYNSFRIISKHILPNIMGPVIVISAANFATAILIEAGLSFLGIGVQPPMPSWGTMIKEHYAYIVLDQAYLAILPGVAIMLMVLSFMLIGNGLRDALDTKTI